MITFPNSPNSTPSIPKKNTRIERDIELTDIMNGLSFMQGAGLELMTGDSTVTDEEASGYSVLMGMLNKRLEAFAEELRNSGDAAND